MSEFTAEEYHYLQKSIEILLILYDRGIITDQVNPQFVIGLEKTLEKVKKNYGAVYPEQAKENSL
jgi:hypothetical protein